MTDSKGVTTTFPPPPGGKVFTSTTRQVTFTKASDATKLRVTYTDSCGWEDANRPGTGIMSLQIVVYVDSTPVAQASWYVGSKNAPLVSPTTVIGLGSNIPSGTHTASIVMELFGNVTPPVSSGPPPPLEYYSVNILLGYDVSALHVEELP